jgi:hypothetical protein
VEFADPGIPRSMNPLFFADWGHINRVFRGLMWAVATVLVCVVCFAVTTRAAARSHPSVAAHASVGRSATGH